MLPGTHVITALWDKIVDSGTSDENDRSSRGGLFGPHFMDRAQDLVSSSSRRNSSSPISGCISPISPPDDNKSSTSNTTSASERTGVSAKDREPGRRAGSCRVCLKSFKPEEYSRICFGCKYKVCEDCASYSQLGENEDESRWSCSVCRRKQQNVQQLIVAQDSTDSLLDIPIVDTLQRRHSDIRIGSSNQGANMQNLGSGLVVPRSPELRRHSDVSPASLKEIEKALLKVASDKREEMRWERELEYRQKQGANSRPSHQQSNKAGGCMGVGGSLRQQERRQSPNEISRDKDKRTENQDFPNNEMTGRRMCTSPKPIPSALAARRKSQVPKQHSCDDENKKGNANMLDSTSGAPRRASAYDVYHKRADTGSLMVSGKEAGRRSSFRVVSPKDNEDSMHTDVRRRASCRSFGSADTGADMSPMGRRASMKLKTGSGESDGKIDIHDEERRARRRGSQLPDINAIKAGLLGSQRSAQSSVPSIAHVDSGYSDPFRRQPSLSGEDIKIVIDDVDQLDLDQMTVTPADVAPIRKVTLWRDPNERVARTRGFGMRVVGGKPGPDGTLYTYIVWTMPGGPAEKQGLRKGDRILFLNGMELKNKSFDEVTTMMDRCLDRMELLVETQSLSRKNSDASDTYQGQSRKKNPEIIEPKEPVISPTTRRRLPKTPLEIHMSESANQEVPFRDKDSKGGEAQAGRIQLELWCKEKKSVLVVSILAADSLPLREDYSFGGCQPQAFVRLRLLPTTETDQVVFSEVAEQNQNPIWNTMLELRAENGNVLEKALEVTIWDQRPDGEQTFIGELVIPEIDLTIDTPVWYRIENPATPGIKTPYKYFPASPTLSTDGTPRSLSEERDSELDGGDGTCGFLHPDHAYLAGSRRGSSQSEQLDVEQYQLSQTFSKSLPGSRRSSFQSTQNTERDIPPVTYSSKGRRRSSCTPRPDPDEILKSLKAVKGELIGRSMSICGGDWRIRRKSSSDRRKESKDSVPEIKETSSEHADDDCRARGDWKLGPFQLEPRFNTFMKGGNIAISLELCITKGQLAVKVCSARGLTPTDNPPDTYVKMYLRDNDRLLSKRKTKVVSKTCNPEFNQTLKYSIREVSDRSLVVMLWERQKGFEHNQGLGSAEIRVDLLKLCEHVTGWYPLFPIQKMGTESNDSP